MTRVLDNKAKQYRAQASGTLGNSFFFWENWKEFDKSKYTGTISLRSMDVSNPIRVYDLPASEARSQYGHLDNIRIYESTPVESRLINGEVSLNVPFHENPRGGLYLFYSLAKMHMRPALEQFGSHTWGLDAKMCLQSKLDPSDYIELMELLRRFPDHIIEFTGFREKVGVMGWKMVIWEVRKY